MIGYMFLLLVLLQVKHWYIDFVNQNQKEIDSKGVYGNVDGLKHSIKHGVATAVILCFFVYEPLIAIIFGFIDFLLHYHIDYVKIHYGNRDNKTSAFWAQLGLDQMAHQLTYLGIVYALFGL